MERVESDLSEALERIQEQWLSNVIHELSNPLFAARGYTRLLLERRANEIDQRFLAATLENIDKVVALTQELGEYPTKNTLVLEPLSLSDLLRDVINDTASTSASRAVRIAAHLATGELATIGDRRKMWQAMRSFCVTMAEFSDPGGLVEVVADENGHEISVQFSTNRQVATDGLSLPDLSMPRKLLKLHGASTAIRYSAEGRYSVLCELAAIRLPKCSE